MITSLVKGIIFSNAIMLSSDTEYIAVTNQELEPHAH
ncbi:hypothetical protein Pecwa_3766 [Pectobacterium parmentieri WPP163]|uniref:Uncharacterized protein n=1 Tax=Pectobacterium parmentieri TaxID=1905730 RepID=A0A0H3ID15_PECPM|nr:hypothetical protein Pecwa_3766 [Pectobacterium parmentieri WPP163]AFI91969.1 Hypothetical protein W5S_3906 [Pectobacterium parmentieri]POW28968.1 hypothetical protein PB20LOC_01401 [Pectobacterium parmentieri]